MSMNLEFFRTLVNGINVRLNELSNVVKDAILKTDQSLSEDEKTKARNNINAASQESVEPFTVYGMGSNPEGGINIDKTFTEIQDAILSGRRVQFKNSTNQYPLSGFGKGYRIEFGNGLVKYEVDTESKTITQSFPNKIYITGSNGSIYRIKVDSSGNLTATIDSDPIV